MLIRFKRTGKVYRVSEVNGATVRLTPMAGSAKLRISRRNLARMIEDGVVEQVTKEEGLEAAIAKVKGE